MFFFITGVTQLILIIVFIVMIVNIGPFGLGEGKGRFAKLAVLALEQRFCH